MERKPVSFSSNILINIRANEVITDKFFSFNEMIMYHNRLPMEDWVHWPVELKNSV